jgi:hypothetical protein
MAEITELNVANFGIHWYGACALLKLPKMAILGCQGLPNMVPTDIE